MERASERGVPWSAARVHHAEVAPRARPRQALGAGAADRVRYGCKVDRSREEFGSGEILASHEDHVGGGNEGRAEHLELAERGGPGGARGAQATAVKLSKHQMRRTAA